MTRRRIMGAAFAALAAAGVLGGCGHTALPDPVTSEGKGTGRLWGLFLTIALVIGLLVYGLVATVLIKDRVARKRAAEPSQRQYVVSLEVVYTVVPLIIVGVLLGVSEAVRRDHDRQVANPDVVVEVQGFQWSWQFRYPDDDIFVNGVPGGDPPELVVPTDRTVRFRLLSNDVVHSFWVPHFITKRDLIPGFPNELEVNIDEAGTWEGVCSEFCGLDHWKMNFTLRALPPDEFDTWVDEHRGEGEVTT